MDNNEKLWTLKTPFVFDWPWFVFLLGTLKISTVCLPVKFEKDETFESFKATVAGYGDYHKNGSMLPDWHQYSANGI